MDGVGEVQPLLMRHGRLREVGLEIFVLHSCMFWWQSPIFFSPYIGHWESGAVGRNDSAQVRTRVSGARYPSMTFDDLVLTVPKSAWEHLSTYGS